MVSDRVVSEFQAAVYSVPIMVHCLLSRRIIACKNNQGRQGLPTCGFIYHTDPQALLIVVSRIRTSLDLICMASSYIAASPHK